MPGDELFLAADFPLPFDLLVDDFFAVDVDFFVAMFLFFF